jgi:long-chain fatty acid transport protein
MNIHLLAAAFATARFGAEHGNPVEANPTALYYNPGAIGFSDGTNLYGDVSIAARRVTWDHQKSGRDVAEPAGAEGANYGKATLFNVFAGPALGATTKIGNLAVGAGLFVPFGGRASWNKNDKFANHPDWSYAADGVQRWHGIEGALTFLYLTAGAAYKLGPISIGASGNFILSSIRSVQAKTFATGDNDMTQEIRSEIDVKGRHGSFAIGALFEAIENKLWIGASYQAQPGLGEMKLKGTLTASDRTGSRPDAIDLHQGLPEIIRFGARFRPAPDLELRLFGDFTRWSRMVTQCITLEDRPCGVKRDGSPAAGTGTVANLYRGWSDTFGIRAGASKWITPATELFVGAGFETAASPDATVEPSLFDSHVVSGALGGRFEIFNKLWVAATYTHLQYLSRTVTTSVLDDPNVHPTTKRVNGNGTYSSFVGILNINVQKQF